MLDFLELEETVGRAWHRLAWAWARKSSSIRRATRRASCCRRFST